MCMTKDAAPKVDTPAVAEEPPAVPTEMDDAVRNARKQQRMMAAAAAGYASTLKTGALGDTSDPNLGKPSLGA